MWSRGEKPRESQAPVTPCPDCEGRRVRVNAPVFPGNDLDKAGFTWATGASGVLSFLRRLDRRSGERLWTASWRLSG
ncbi:hypothetical protein AB0L05_10925 [Nonomuraea pusilla]|uniref:hypothetical protein n=1 Tax=Nonomuraea pusilla TaxID=46177 RepID=UPI003327B36E